MISAGAWAIVIAVASGAAMVAAGVSEHRRVFWGLIGALSGAVFIWGASRVKLTVDTHQIAVSNVGRTHRVPWDMVARIDVPDWWPSPSVIVVGVSAVRITTRDARKIVIDASIGDEVKVLEALGRFSVGRTVFDV